MTERGCLAPARERLWPFDHSGEITPFPNVTLLLDWIRVLRSNEINFLPKTLWEKKWRFEWWILYHELMEFKEYFMSFDISRKTRLEKQEIRHKLMLTLSQYKLCMRKTHKRKEFNVMWIELFLKRYTPLNLATLEAVSYQSLEHIFQMRWLVEILWKDRRGCHKILFAWHLSLHFAEAHAERIIWEQCVSSVTLDITYLHLCNTNCTILIDNGGCFHGTNSTWLLYVVYHPAEPNAFAWGFI